MGIIGEVSLCPSPWKGAKITLSSVLRVELADNDSDDAKPYQEKQVRELLLDHVVSCIRTMTRETAH